MPHVITQPCCSDASCVYACPVNCIHPTPDEPDFLTAEMLHIDPQACVDCGACVSACPVDAIVPESKLGDDERMFTQINADFYREQRERPVLAPVLPAAEVRSKGGPLRVAIVGSGPSAMYAADELLTQPGVQVDVFDRLPVPHGLVRRGVAPDHQNTKRVTGLFDSISAQDGFRYYLGVSIGEDLTHEELLQSHHAVVYAVGASSDRRLGVPGEDLPGVGSATDFVAWYNGDPDHADDSYDLSGRRAVIIGNGNVALDVARILTADPEELAGTDISDAALEALRGSGIEEVVIAGRRGTGQSAFTVPEFAGLIRTPGVDVAVGPAEPDGHDDRALDSATRAGLADDALPHAVRHKLALLDNLRLAAAGARRRISMRYLLSPTRIVAGDDGRVAGIEFARNRFRGETDRVEPTGESTTVAAGLVLTSIGYRGTPVPGVPFDDSTGTIPNDGGRVLTSPPGDVPAGGTAGAGPGARPDAVPGTYVTGWAKRGPSGFIGTNKSCARETVGRLVDDFNAGRLAPPRMDASRFDAVVRSRRPDVIDRDGWRAIDAAERARGTDEGRVRHKIVDPAEAAAVASAPAADGAGRRRHGWGGFRRRILR
ncbi:FAD-dependent oxidoreductase [Tomitella fengzijianii]|uniref:ferredoxin--NADP(+) reductase n=1 Tax=Tomitella fengzijianii TaxID=2597660 RepID=A0A516X748_9ACTN|nr:FAD-dependent oxidoreductase [Tomitella fengzijianii]QDQ98491.1 4Fe-4S ferredoxin [Tomitella fengzijianii]